MRGLTKDERAILKRVAREPAFGECPIGFVFVEPESDVARELAKRGLLIVFECEYRFSLGLHAKITSLGRLALQVTDEEKTGHEAR